MKRLFLLVVTATSIAGTAIASEYPQMGVIASSTEISSINYSCTQSKKDISNYRKIDCEIYYQTLKKGKNKFQKAEIEKEFKKTGIPKDMCTAFGNKNVLDLTVAEVQSDLDKSDSTRNSFNKDLIAEMVPILQKMCKEKTLESVVKLVEFTSQIDANTCEIESSKTRETFIELPQKRGERSLWVSESSNIPPCGRKDIIKFIPLSDNTWSIQFEQMVINKSSKDDDGKTCKSIEGVKNIFNSHNKVWDFPCKYIKLANKGAWSGPFNPK